MPEEIIGIKNVYKAFDSKEVHMGVNLSIEKGENITVDFGVAEAEGEGVTVALGDGVDVEVGVGVGSMREPLPARGI